MKIKKTYPTVNRGTTCIPSFRRQTKEKMYTGEQPAEQSAPKCNGDPQGETFK